MVDSPRVAVRAIITNSSGKVLVLKRDNTNYSQDLWNLPGGKVEYNESVENALIKEILEETGLQITESSFLTYLDGLPDISNGPHFITLIFVCSAIGNIKLNGESSKYRWIEKEEMKDIEIAFRNGDALKLFWSN